MTHLIVQLPDRIPTSNALIESRFDIIGGGIITFCAYSDAMKARVLELIAAGREQVHVTAARADDEPCSGEWLEQDLRGVACNHGTRTVEDTV